MTRSGSLTRWIRFVDDLASSDFGSLARNRSGLEFGDLSAVFCLRIAAGEDGAVALRVSCGISRPKRHMSFETIEHIDDDTFGHLQRAFADCPIR